jgi:hypothetical protein
MTVDEILLQKLVKWRPESSRPVLEVADPDNGWTVRLTAECVEQVGSRLNELVLLRLTPLTAVDLSARAQVIANQVTGLLEPLRLIEVDNNSKTALLRSQTPNQRGDNLFYYEVQLQADGGCTLRRFQAARQAGVRRQQVAFTLTHEALAKIVTDLTRPS